MRPRLTAIVGDRRTTGRGQSFRELTVQARLADGTEQPALLTADAPGLATLRFDGQFESELKLAGIRMNRFTTIDCGDRWSMRSQRRTPEGVVVSIESKDRSFLERYSHLVDPRTFLQESHYRIFRSGSDSDVVELSAVLTLIKDCAVQTRATFHSKDSAVSVLFDFSANRSDLSVLDLTGSGDLAQSALSPGVLEFTFLAVRYLLPCSLGEYDGDFQVVSALLLGEALAVSNRRFDRQKCSHEAQIRLENSEATHAVMTEISPEGAVFRLKSPCPAGLVAKAPAILDTQGESIPIHVASSKTFEKVTTIRAVFVPETDRELQATGRLFFKSLQGPTFARASDLYQQTLSLYEKVGYGPRKGIDRDEWSRQSIETWGSLDEAILGNCAVHMGADGTADVAMSALPLSAQSVYGHSLAMTYSLETALSFTIPFAISQCLLAFTPGAQIYAGSYRKTSRFATRLHISFTSGPKPLAQEILHSLTWWNPHPDHGPSEGVSFEWSETLPANLLTQLSARFGDSLLYLIGPPVAAPPGFAMKYVIIRQEGTGKELGLAIVTNFLPYSSATDFVNHSFLALDGELENSAAINGGLIQFIAQSDPGMTPSRASILVGRGSPTLSFTIANPPPGADYRDLFWTFTPRDELNCLNQSLARCSYDLCRKYGKVGLEAYAQSDHFR